MPQIPEQMTAVEITTPGAPDVLKPTRRPVPKAAEGEVLVRVMAAGVNRPDVAQREGKYPPPPGASDIPGLEIAGEIVALGTGVTRWRVGERITALVTGGGYAEYCTAPADQCLAWPKGFDAVQAAAIPENWYTVWSNVMDRGQLKAGEVFLVQGGASGIGVAAIQLGKMIGARVFATAGSDERARACESMGAERGINYRSEDFVAVVKAATNGHGTDLTLDMVAGSYVDREITLAAEDGRIVLIANLGGPTGQISFLNLYRKRLSLTGSTLRIRPVAFKAALAEALQRRVWPWFESGVIAPVIDSVFPLAEAAKAHARMEASGHIGKIVLKIDQS